MLCLALGKTKRQLKRQMSMREYHEWARFYSHYPFDDFSRYHRPAALIAQSMAGGKIEDKLNWLQPQPSAPEDAEYGEQYSSVDVSILKAFGILPGAK